MNTLKLTRKKEYTIVQMHRGKVNAINYEMVQELRQVFQDLERDKNIRGVILTGQPKYFSAGLDLIELYQYNEQQIDDFFQAFGMLYIEMLRFTKPFISAITGHSPAGGCVLAVTSDNRIMAEGPTFTIGLNEVAVNIQISQNLTDVYGFWIGTGLAHRFILQGKLLTGSEALAVGLIDALVPLDQVLEQAESKMMHYMRANQEILVSTKNKLRKTILDRLHSDSSDSFKEAVTIWWKPETRASMKAYIESFTKKR